MERAEKLCEQIILGLIELSKHCWFCHPSFMTTYRNDCLIKTVTVSKSKMKKKNILELIASHSIREGSSKVGSYSMEI